MAWDWLWIMQQSQRHLYSDVLPFERPVPCLLSLPWRYLHGGGTMDPTMDPQWVETIIVGWIGIVYRIM